MKKIKKLLCIGVASSVILSSVSVFAQKYTNENGDYIETGVSVVVDNQGVSFQGVHEPVIMNDSTMVPMRVLFELLNATVVWNENNMSITANTDDTIINMAIGSNIMYVNNEPVTLPVAPTLMKYDDYSDTTMVPLRAVSEAFGCDITWNEKDYTVDISTKTPAKTPDPSPTPTYTTNFNASEIQTENRVSAYQNNIAYIKDDGTVYNGTSDTNFTKIDGISNAIAVAIGRNIGFALTNNGEVYSWGTANDFGQLGRDALDSKAQKIDELSDIVKIGAGSHFAAALKKDGDLYTWGRNDKGQLGDGSTENASKPTKVELNGVKDFAVGLAHVVAVNNSGSVYTWGENGEGQLGRGSTQTKYLSKPGVVTNLQNIESVYASSTSSGAIRSEKSVYMWGTTYLGELGTDEKPIQLDGTVNPVIVETDSDGYYRFDKPRRISYCYYDYTNKEYFSRVLLNIESVSLGEYQGAAISDGKLYMWGKSPLLSPKLKSQFEHYCAMEYAIIKNPVAVYSGSEKAAYVLDSDGNLWEAKYNSTNVISKFR